MKTLVYIALIFLFVWFVPFIPYDRPEQSGVVCIEHKTVGSWLYEQYQINQANRENH